MDARSTRIAARLNPFMLVAAALTLPTVAITESAPGGGLERIGHALNWITWLAFLFEFVVMMSVSPDRKAWLRRHPLDCVIVFLTPPVLPAGLQSLRALRLLRLLRLFRLAQLSREAFSLEGVRYSALLALLSAIGGAALFGAFEHQQHLTFWEDLYWAVTTMTTLGSGIEPSTTGGQIVSVVVLLVGIGFVALLTGSFAQRFLAPEISELERELEEEELSAEQVALRELKSVQQQLQALEIAVEQMVSQRGAAREPGG